MPYPLLQLMPTSRLGFHNKYVEQMDKSNKLHYSHDMYIAMRLIACLIDETGNIYMSSRHKAKHI